MSDVKTVPPVSAGVVMSFVDALLPERSERLKDGIKTIFFLGQFCVGAGADDDASINRMADSLRNSEFRDLPKEDIDYLCITFGRFVDNMKAGQESLESEEE